MTAVSSRGQSQPTEGTCQVRVRLRSAQGNYHSSSTFKLAAARSGQPGLASRKSTWQGGSGRTSRPPTARPAGKPPRPGIRPGDHDGTRAHCRHCPRASRACQGPPCLPPWQRWQIKGHIERSPEPGLGTSGAYKLAHVHVTPARRIGEVDLSQPPCDAVIPTSTAVAALRLVDVGFQLECSMHHIIASSHAVLRSKV